MWSFKVVFFAFLGLFISSFVLFTTQVPTTYAADGDCDSITAFSITPSAGDTNTPFTITGTIANCKSISNPQFRVFGENPNKTRNRDFSEQVRQANGTTGTDASGNFTLKDVRFPENGNWKIEVVMAGAPIPDKTLSVVIAAGTQKKCGETVGKGGSSLTYEKLCPSNCPATIQSDSQTWVCQLQQKDAESNCNTSVDVSTLIACSTLNSPVLANPTRCGAENKGYACGDPKHKFCEESDAVKCAAPRISCKADKTCDNGLTPQTIKADGKESCFCVEKTQVAKAAKTEQEKIKCTGDNCTKAAGKFCDDGSLSTAIGCVPVRLNSFVNASLVWTAGIAGGVAFLLMIMGSLRMVMSQGNAEDLKKGREQFVAAISGLLFIIFSITLLQIIGADILGIPGFER